MNERYKPPGHIVPVIVAAQFLCTSLWFAGNAVTREMSLAYGFGAQSDGYLTIAVTLGFIGGTLVFAILSLADRYPPSRVFLISGLAGAATNLMLLLDVNTFATVLVWRFATGVCLAGIYPVGMKIASDYHQRGLGRALGYLVGALVIGTALPHGIRAATAGFPWQTVIVVTSGLSVAGALLLFLSIPNGPFRKAATSLKPSVILTLFKAREFRAAATGYFGHMWELYAFWTFVPFMLAVLGPDINLSLWAFVIIGAGGVSCVVGGYVSQRYSSAAVAFTALVISGLCCICSWFLPEMGPLFGTGFLVIWGIAVIMDSPQFSTLVAQTAPAENSGTALTIVNSIGFAIAMISIQVITLVLDVYDAPWIYVILGAGPVAGLVGMRTLI